MSFGFSVGDFITVLQFAKDVRRRFVDAPEEFKAISQDMKALANVLEEVDDVLSQRDLSNQQKKSLAEVIEGCYNVLEQLRDALDKYQEIDSSAKGISGKSRRVWRKLHWDQGDIDHFRSRITLNISIFGTFLGQISSNASFATKAGVDRLHEREDDRERREEYQVIWDWLDWLIPIDYSHQQNDLLSQRQDGTGQWLLKSKEFQGWVDRIKPTLFCPGIPGAGKTMLTSIVIEHLWFRFQNEADVGIAFLYCNFRRQHEQKPMDLFLSLLKQLIPDRSQLPESVRSLYKHHKSRRSRPSLEEMLSVLHSLITNYSKTYIIIDALDECQAADGSRKRLLSELFKLQLQNEISLFATSRFIPEIVNEFEESMIVEIRASDEDVQRYLEGHMSYLSACVSRNSALQMEIKDNIIKAVDGMFLLAQLHLKSLTDKTTPRTIRRALEKLPKGSKALDQAYEDAIQRVHSQEAGFRELAEHVLSWIVCARRPLTISELQHGLAVEIGDSELGDDNFQDIEEIVSVCAGLLIVDEESNIIRLVHYTTQEYFERTQKFWFPGAEGYIARSCVTYLSFDVFESGFCETYDEFEARLQSNVLYDYASRSWGYHARAASIEGEPLILSFLRSDDKVSASNQVIFAFQTHVKLLAFIQDAATQVTGLHLAAYFGLLEATESLLASGHDVDSKDSDGRTPLFWAAMNANETAMKLLLDRHADIECKDDSGHTPLSWAAMSGYDTIVKLLLDRNADIESNHTVYGQTPLSWAAMESHEVVVKLLLDRNAHIESQDSMGRTPLSWAAKRGVGAAIELLLDNHADIESKDTEFGRTPLVLAAMRGREAVVKLLLDRNADIESKDRDNRTPLLWAAREGHEAVVKLLLDRHADTESKDTRYGQTPLSWAAMKGHKAVVKLLLDRNADIETTDKHGRNPLSWAVKKGHRTVMELLLNWHTDTNIRQNILKYLAD